MLRQKFDKDMVLQQLKSSGTISYVHFMKIGFPVRLAIESLDRLYAPYYYRIYTSKEQFLGKIFRFVGYAHGEFRFGKDNVFFRTDKPDLMDGVLSTDKKIIEEIERRSLSIRKRWRNFRRLLVDSM